MTDYAKIKGVQEIFWEIDIKELMNRIKTMFRTSTRLKILRIPRSEKIGFESVLGALKVISVSAHFCDGKI